MEFNWITEFFPKLEMKFSSISFLILSLMYLKTATNHRVKIEKICSFLTLKHRSGGMLGHCYLDIPHGEGFRNWALGKGFLFSFAVLI